MRWVSPGPLLGFVVHFCDDAIFLVHEVVMNFFQLPEVGTKHLRLNRFTQTWFLRRVTKKKESPEEDDVGSDAEQHGDDAVTNQMQVPSPPLLSLLCGHVLRVSLTELRPVTQVLPPVGEAMGEPLLNVGVWR